MTIYLESLDTRIIGQTLENKELNRQKRTLLKKDKVIFLLMYVQQYIKQLSE